MARLKTSLSQPEHQGHQDPKAQRENVLPPISGLAVVEQNACSHQESKEHQEGNERSNFCRSKKSVHFILRSCSHNRQTPANEGRMLRRHPKNQLQNTTLKAQDLSSITWEGRNKSAKFCLSQYLFRFSMEQLWQRTNVQQPFSMLPFHQLRFVTLALALP